MTPNAAEYANLKRLKALISKSSGIPRRNKLLPGESLVDYNRELSLALSEDKTEPEFEWGRLVRNGWTLEDERRYRENARVIKYDLYSYYFRDNNGIRRKAGYDLVDEGDRLMREGKFPGQKIREPGADDEEAI